MILERISILLFFINLGYKPIIYNILRYINILLNLVNKIIEILKNLYRDLAKDITFYI